MANQRTAYFVITRIQWLFETTHRKKFIILLFGIALLVRFTALAILPEAHLSTNAKNSILRGATLIQNGEFIGNPDYPMLVPPLTAMFVAGIQSVFGNSLIPIKIAQIVMDAFMVVVVFSLGRIILPYAAAVVGSLLLSTYPFTVFSSIYVGTEALFTFLLVLFMYLAIKAIKEERLILFFIAGFFLGLATLTRGTTLFFPLVFVMFLFWYNKGRARLHVISQSLLFALGFAIVLTPWTIRNHVVLNAAIPASTSSGPLLHGSSEEFWLIEDRERELPKYFRYLKDEKGISGSPNPSWVQKDQFYRKAAIEKYRQRWEENPWSYFHFFIQKFTRLWYATESGANHTLVLLINLPFYVLGLFGFWMLIRSGNRLAGLISVLLLYVIALHVAVFAYFRYVVPIMPYVLLFAAYGGTSLVQKYWKDGSTHQVR